MNGSLSLVPVLGRQTSVHTYSPTMITSDAFQPFSLQISPQHPQFGRFVAHFAVQPNRHLAVGLQADYKSEAAFGQLDQPKLAPKFPVGDQRKSFQRHFVLGPPRRQTIQQGQASLHVGIAPVPNVHPDQRNQVTTEAQADDQQIPPTTAVFPIGAVHGHATRLAAA